MGKKKGLSKRRKASAMDVVEHRKAASLNLILSQEEKEKILLPSVLEDGFAGIDVVLQIGMSIIERKDGALECLDCQLNRAVSRDGGRTWGEYSVMEDLMERRKAGAGTGLLGFGWIRLPSGRIGMGWNEVGKTPEGHRFNRLWWRTSSDEGKTWSKDARINPTGEMGSPYHGEPMRVTSSGRLVLPVRASFNGGEQMVKNLPLSVGWWKGEMTRIEGHYHFPEIDIAYVTYSDDEGKTWRRADGDIFGWLHNGWNNVTACDEPAVEELRDGRLTLLARSTCGRLLASFSADGGEHWSIVEASGLASSYSPCALKKIPGTGDLLCVWNQVSVNEIRQGKGRGRLSAAITADGKEWKHFRTLERHGRMEEADRIAVEGLLAVCRSLDDVGDIPLDRGFSDYPTIAFHGDDVIVSYPQCKGMAADLVSAMKVRVLPVDWFYAAP